MFAFDDEMIDTPHLANRIGHEPPTLHLNALWEEGRNVRDTTPAAGAVT